MKRRYRYIELRYRGTKVRREMLHNACKVGLQPLMQNVYILEMHIVLHRNKPTFRPSGQSAGLSQRSTQHRKLPSNPPQTRRDASRLLKSRRGPQATPFELSVSAQRTGIDSAYQNEYMKQSTSSRTTVPSPDTTWGPPFRLGTPSAWARLRRASRLVPSSCRATQPGGTRPRTTRSSVSPDAR